MSFPPIEPVHARGACASNAGPRKSDDEQRVFYLDDGTAAFALVARGISNPRSGRYVADKVADLATSTFRERTSSMLDDLAEVWWRSEHEGARMRPFASLPIGDRAELRGRVKKLLADRVPDALGDQAVLEAERTRLLELPLAVLRRAGKNLQRYREEKGGNYRDDYAVATAALFAAGKATVAHIGDGRAVLVRDRRLEPLTQAHTLENEIRENHPDVTPEQLAMLRGTGPVRLLGMDGDPHRIDVVTRDLRPGDLFLLLSGGAAASFSDDDLRRTVLAHGIEAVRILVDGGKADNVGAVAVEIR